VHPPEFARPRHPAPTDAACLSQADSLRQFSYKLLIPFITSPAGVFLGWHCAISSPSLRIFFIETWHKVEDFSNKVRQSLNIRKQQKQ
jgi:hypothetical protein